MTRHYVKQEPRPPEVWRDVPGTGGAYQASSRGRVRRLLKTRPPRILKPFIIRHATARDLTGVNLYFGGTRKQMSLLRVVALAFFPGRIPEGCYVVHKNGQKTDNRPENVRIVRPETSGRLRPGNRRKGVALVDAEGEVLEAFSSVTAASEVTGIARETIRRHCEGLGTRPLPEGMTFRWDEEVRY